MYRVVVVEDETIVRKGIVRNTDWGSVDCMVIGDAGNGEEGLALIRKLRPDLVITDIRMPKMTGIEMAEILQEEKITPIIIFLTAYDDFAYAQRAIRVGACDYVLKPFKDNVLEEAIRDIMKKNRRDSAEQSELDAQLPLKKGDKSKYLTAALQSGILCDVMDNLHANPNPGTVYGRAWYQVRKMNIAVVLSHDWNGNTFEGFKRAAEALQGEGYVFLPLFSRSWTIDNTEILFW